MPPVKELRRRDRRRHHRANLTAATRDLTPSALPHIGPGKDIRPRDLQERIYALRRVSPIIRYYGDFKWNLALKTIVSPGQAKMGEVVQLGTMDTKEGNLELSDKEKRVLSVFKAIPNAQRTIADLVMQRALVGQAAVIWQKERPVSDEAVPFVPIVRSVVETHITDHTVEYKRPGTGPSEKYLRVNFGTALDEDLPRDMLGTAAPYTSIRPSADYSTEPDSPLFSIVHLIEELYSLQLTMLAITQSQTPAWLALLNSDAIRSEEDQEEFEESWFNALAGAIEEPGAGQSILPHPVWIPGNYMRGEEKFLELVQVARNIDPNTTDREGEILNRAAVALNMRMETFTGFANVKYSNAIVITRDEFRSHFEPEFMDALADWERIIWRPHAKANGLNPDDWPLRYTSDAVVADPNLEEKLTRGVEIGAISPRYWRSANGYPDDAAPTELEIMLQLLFKRGILDTDFDPRMTLALFEGLGMDEFVPDTYINPDEVRAEEDVQTGAESRGQVVEAAALTAAAGVRLGDFDAQLLRDLQLILDEGLTRAARAVDRRIKSEATSSKAPDGFAQVAKPCQDGTARQLVQAFGRPQVERWFQTVTDLGVAGSVATQLDRTLDRVDALLAGTHTTLNRLTERLFGAAPVDFTIAREAALSVLARELADLGAELVLVGPPQAGRGETSDVLISGKMIREVMSIAGGGRFVDGVDGLVANGVLLTTSIRAAGWVEAGLTWKYGVTPRATQFEPHEALDGVTFRSWSDNVLANDSDLWIGSPHYSPGDHDGCLCTWAVTWERRQ